MISLKTSRKADKLAAFTAQLLAPLPDDVEPVGAKAFRKALQADMVPAWQQAEREWRFLYHTAQALDAKYLLEGGDDRASEDACDLARRASRSACRRLLLTPAPWREQLRWKKGNMGLFDGDVEVAAAIAADEARLTQEGR